MKSHLLSKLYIFPLGCLSFINRVEDVIRYNEIVISDNLVYPQRAILTGLMAVCVQHELDHLNGVTFFERMNSVQRSSAIKKFSRIKKKL